MQLRRLLIRFSASCVWALSSVVAQAAPAKVALLHSNPALRQLDQNIAQLNDLVAEAFRHGANIVVTPELATTGYCLTREQVLEDLGIAEPYPELAAIRDLAIAYHGYVFVGIAEVTPEGAAFNSVVAYGPRGYLRTQAKRSLPLWHDRGTTPIEPITTPYGDLAILICSDSYLPDMSRIATLHGADVILTSANWWGPYGQEEIWQIRAQENGVWFFVANRWGEEIDDRYSPPYLHNMNDAPSVVVDPNGNLLQIHRAEDDPEPHTTILYQNIDVPEWRIGNALTPTYSVVAREPGAYGQLANLYYRRDLGHVEYPGLPAPGIVRVSSMAYRPDVTSSLATIRGIWSKGEHPTDVLALPGLGISMVPIDAGDPNWFRKSPWSDVQAFIESNGISLLVTSALDHAGSQVLLLLRPGQPPELQRQIHDSIVGQGSKEAPRMVDLPRARVGVLLGRDALFPEASTQLAKSGADVLIITSTVGTWVPGAPFLGVNYFSDSPTLERMWRVRSNESVHVVAADWTGTGIIVENGGGYISRVLSATPSTPLATMDLDSSLVRFKYLNAYESHDLATLLGR